jgi:hypothetical protein
MFDIAVSHDSINHLNETACSTLHQNHESRAVYVDVFRKLKSILNPGAVVIICDCSRYNFFHSLGVRNPVARKIEWHKHQDPHVWAGILAEAGFTHPVIRWSSFHSLGMVGRMLLGNRIAAYFLHSHFRLTVTS